VNKTELPVLHKDPVRGKKRLWQAALTLVVALSAALTATVAGPASAAVQAPARTAAAPAAAVNDLTATSLQAMARYVHLSHGRYVLDTSEALKAGVSRQAVDTESALVADMNKALDPGTAAVSKENDGVVLDSEDGVTMNAATALSDAGVQASDYTITILQGVTIEVNSTGIYISMTATAVSEFKDAAASAEDITKLVVVVGDILLAVGAVITAAVAAVPSAGISAPVAAALWAAATAIFNALGVGVEAVLDFASQVVELCAASDGSAEFAITLAPPFLSCS
jgi:hypothetical protein